MLHLANNNCIFSFSKDNKPVLKVKSGDQVEISTLDCMSNQIQSEDCQLDNVDWNEVNPATGPIYIENAVAGDTLKVKIEKLQLDSKGVVSCYKGEGPLGALTSENSFHILNINDDYADFLGKYKIPVNKMIGVIGVAPQGDAISTGTPGRHGGNMDTTLITEGSTLYLPVATDGALFALGDVHGVMGNGEVGGTGLEIPAKVTVTLEILKDKPVEYPILENEEAFAVIVSKSKLDEAADCATYLMCKFLENHMDMATEDIIMLMSLAGNLEISQIVDPLKTARFVFPKKYMDNTDF